MEVISLGLLAMASGVFLAKARSDKKARANNANKKEGFNNADSLFGTVAQNTLPDLHKDFVARSVSYFNPFASLLNTNKTSISFSNNNSEADWTYDAPDNTTSANLFRSLYSKPGPGGVGHAIDDELGEKYATGYRVPPTSVLSNILNTCEKTSVRGALIKEFRNSNNQVIASIHEADCSVFQNDGRGFSNVCGICHEGNCTNAIGSNIVDTPQGLFVSSRLKMDPSPEKLQMESLASGRSDLTSMLVGPTLGSCTMDRTINRNNFSINYESCVANNKHLQCKYGQDFSKPGCYMCSTDGQYYFVDNSNGIFSVRQPTTFTFGGRGKAFLLLFDTNGTTQLGYLNNPDSDGVLTFTANTINPASLSATLSNQYIITLQEMTNNTMPWKIAVTSNGEAAAGQYLQINLYGSGSVPYVQGQFFGSLRSKSSVDKTDFTLTAMDITNGSSNAFYISANYGMKMQPTTVNGVQGSTAIFKVLVPYLYINTSNIEANYCTGPFIKNGNNAALLSNSPCSAASSTPGNYSEACLQRLFLTAGCSVTGDGYPSNSNKALALMNLAAANVGSNANKGDIIGYVYSQFQRSWSGLDATGRQLTANEWNDSKKFCKDSNTVRGNPCTDLPVYTQENGPLSDECINYIYANGFYSDSNNVDYGTYSNSNAASLFGENNSMSPMILRSGYVESFVGSSKKDRYCTEFGSVSPLAGGANMASAKAVGGVNALKSFYNNIHAKANQLNMTNAERAQWVAQCYGDTLNVQADADPIIQKGMEISATTCGTGGLSMSNRSTDEDKDQDQGIFTLPTPTTQSSPIGNIRAVRVWGNGSQVLQISQLVVLDSRGQNVALNKPTSYFSIYEGINRSSVAVDGALTIREYPGIYHSGGSGLAEYFQVDLRGQYDIVQIIYFNRITSQDRATGTTIALYNNHTTTSAEGNTKNNAIYTSALLTNAPVQYINLAKPNSEASCPKILSGQRGGLIGGQTTANDRRIKNNIDQMAITTSYAVYNLNVDLSKTLGDSSSTTTAEWIWNHPYANEAARPESVGFYTYIYNTANIRKNYYVYYKCDDTVSSVIFNGVTIPNAPSGNWGQGNTGGSKLLLVALPGQNLLQILCNNYAGRACFIAAIYGNGSWISKTDSTQTNFYSPTNASSTTGYSWRSYTAPNIGTIFVDNRIEQTKYLITNPPSYADCAPHVGCIHPAAKWIWNQPDAGRYANKPDTVRFYFYITIAGTAILTYTLYIESDGGPSATTQNSSVKINTLDIGVTGHANYTGSMDTKTFSVVPGRNLLQVDVTTSGIDGPAGFRAYITDNNGAVVSGSETSATSSWVCTTPTSWSLTNACVYVPNNGITYNCAANVWGSNCTQNFTNNIYDGDPTASSNALKDYNKSNMGSQLYDWWGSNSRANGGNSDGSNRQNACLGKTVCETGYTYNSSTDALAGKCTSSGLADNTICPTGYTYVSGFDSNSCQRTTAASLISQTSKSAFPAKLCSNIPYSDECYNGFYGDNGDGCSWSGDSTASQAAMNLGVGRCVKSQLAGNIGHGGTLSYQDRTVGRSCPSGTTVDPTTDSGGNLLKKFCIPNPLTAYTTKNLNVNCGRKIKSIIIQNHFDILQIARIAVYDIYGFDVTGTTGTTVTATNSIGTGTTASQTQAMVNRIIKHALDTDSNPLAPADYNNKYGSEAHLANMYHSEGSQQNVLITFPSEVDIVAFVYYNRRDCCSGRAESNYVQLLNSNGNMVQDFGKIPLNGQLANNISFTNGLVQYFDIRTLGRTSAPTCEPYYNNCPSGETQQTNGSCLSKTAATNWKNPQF